METRFEWDSDKARTNLRKHGVAFAVAAAVFRDPLHETVQDRIEGGEYRWRSTGHVDGVGLIVVAHTVDEDDEGELVRIISARPATRRERRVYEQDRSI